MLDSALLDEIEEVFHLKLDEKTNWGKEQVKIMYTKSVLEVLKRNFDYEK